MLRGLLLTVLAANLGFFGWSQAWFAPTWPGPRAAQGEPQRLANQFQPDWVQVLPASAAGVARSAAATLCLEAGPLSEASMATAEAALAAASVPADAWAFRADRSGERWLRAPAAPPAVQAQLLALPPAALPDVAGGFRPCRAP